MGIGGRDVPLPHGCEYAQTPPTGRRLHYFIMGEMDFPPTVGQPDGETGTNGDWIFSVDHVDGDSV